MADAVYKALGMDGAADVWAAARQLRERCVAAATPYAAYEELDAPLAAMWAVALVFALAAAIALARRCRRQRRWPAKERRTAAAPTAPATGAKQDAARATVATASQGAADAAPPTPAVQTASDGGRWPAAPPLPKGQLPRQCDCFLGANYFIDHVRGKPIGVHFEYNGDQSVFLEQYGRMYDSAIAEAIVHELEQQRQQRLTAESRAEERKRAIQQAYTPQYAHVRRLAAEYLDPEFRRLVALAQEARTSADAMQQLRQAAPPLSPDVPDVFELPVFDTSFCAQLVSELQHIRSEMDDSLLERPNSMNQFGVLLDDFGFTPHFTDVLESEYVRPLAAALLGPEYATLDNHR